MMLKHEFDAYCQDGLLTSRLLAEAQASGIDVFEKKKLSSGLPDALYSLVLHDQLEPLQLLLNNHPGALSAEMLETATVLSISLRSQQVQQHLLWLEYQLKSASLANRRFLKSPITLTEFSPEFQRYWMTAIQSKNLQSVKFVYDLIDGLVSLIRETQPTIRVSLDGDKPTSLMTAITSDAFDAFRWILERFESESKPDDYLFGRTFSDNTNALICSSAMSADIKFLRYLVETSEIWHAQLAKDLLLTFHWPAYDRHREYLTAAIYGVDQKVFRIRDDAIQACALSIANRVPSGCFRILQKLRVTAFDLDLWKPMLVTPAIHKIVWHLTAASPEESLVIFQDLLEISTRAARL